jgi:hypothetical protein
MTQRHSPDWHRQSGTKGVKAGLPGLSLSLEIQARFYPDLSGYGDEEDFHVLNTPIVQNASTGRI